MIELIINSQPPSVNHCYLNTGKGGRIRTKQYLEWINTTLDEIVPQLPIDFKCIGGQVELSIKIGNFGRRRRDLDNYLKALLDVLSGIVYNDDSQISRLIVERDNNLRSKIIFHLDCSASSSYQS
jgi:crossover junction endodeoxyribonuclease RusA